MAGVEGVREVHDLYIWTITSGFPALSAHVLVGYDEDCHARRYDLEELLAREYGIEHTTLQVDHAGDHVANGVQFLSRRDKERERAGTPPFAQPPRLYFTWIGLMDQGKEHPPCPR